MVQLEAAYRRFSPSDALPDRSRRLQLALLILVVLVILNMVWLGLLLLRAPVERAAESTSAQSATPGGLSSSAVPPASEPRSGSAERETIQLHNAPESAKPFQTVRIQGTYRGGADTFVRVQRWEAGKWLDFPVPTKTDQSGKFTAYVELDQPGRYQLRILDPESGMTSTSFVLVIKG
ncbi:MAG TPA: hypothetical protein VI094_15170 [Propionibacteriaceae bacterium]